MTKKFEEEQLAKEEELNALRRHIAEQVEREQMLNKEQDEMEQAREELQKHQSIREIELMNAAKEVDAQAKKMDEERKRLAADRTRNAQIQVISRCCC